MPSRYGPGPRARDGMEGRRAARYQTKAKPGGGRRFRWNAVNLALIAVVLAAGAVIGAALLSRGNRAPAGAGAPGQTRSPGAVQTDPPASAGGSGAAQPSTSPSPAISAGAEAPSAAGTAPGITAAPAKSAVPSAEAADQGYFTSGGVQTDATSYRSRDLYVKITNVNDNGVHYYVADCRMKDGGKLFTALAGDKYALHKGEPSSEMARRKGAVIAVDGDYYGYRTEGVVIRNGTLYRKTPYWDVAAIYKDGTMKTFAKDDVTAEGLISGGAQQAFGFGPMLLDENGKAFPEAKMKAREPKVNPANPRSGIGYIAPNHFVLVVVDGRGAGGSRGMTQTEFSKLFESLGCRSAYNLDGGGSATMVFMGKVINHPCDPSGERAVSDIVYFGESETDQANIDRMNGQ